MHILAGPKLHLPPREALWSLLLVVCLTAACTLALAVLSNFGHETIVPPLLPAAIDAPIHGSAKSDGTLSRFVWPDSRAERDQRERDEDAARRQALLMLMLRGGSHPFWSLR